ncbi:MAG: hypothetical protein KBD53_05490, partial [Candidatus Omnitrophica bacterium]|nr:hypothetical protein [Candidatus Omnitrophota bacterium]
MHGFATQEDSFTNELIYEVNFDLKDITATKINEFDSLTLPDTLFTHDVGRPQFPVKVINFAIDQNKKVVGIDLLTDETEVVLGEFNIYPAPESTQVGEDAAFSSHDPKIYASSESFPGKKIELGSTGFSNGTKIAGFLVYPLEYIPSQKKAILHTKMKFKVLLADDDSKNLVNKPVIQPSAQTRKVIKNWLSKIVVNPEDASANLSANHSETENSKEGLANPMKSHDYLIITNNELRDSGVFSHFIDYKTRRGLSVLMETVENINSTMPGRDSPEKIRNYIKKVHEENGVMWVLLGGDTNIVPTRLVRPEQIPSDLYFSDLDGDWDLNGNSVFGENADNLDMYADVFVGRAPGENIAEMLIFVKKILNYDILTPNYFKRVLLFGFKDYNDIGGRTNDLIEQNILPEEVKPATKYYGRDIYGYHDQARAAINEGYHLINHIDTASSVIVPLGQNLRFGNEIYSLLNNDDFDAFTNQQSPSIMTSSAPWAGAFDLQSPDAISERWINNPTGGGVAFFGYSRTVYTDSIGTLDKELYNALYAQKITHLGQMLATAKAKFIPYISYFPNRMALLSFNLLGDPEMTVMIQEDAEITKPVNNTVVQGVVDVEGTMDSTDFHSYNLSYARKDNPYQNILITSSITPVVDGLLGTWDTEENALEDGWYTLILDVVKADFTHVKTVTDVYLNNKKINLPPIFQHINTPSIVEGQPFELPVIANDPEGGRVEISAAMENGEPLSTIGASFIDNGDGTATFDWTPGTGHEFQYPILFQAQDEKGNTADVTVRITVIRRGNQLVGTVKEFINGVWTKKPEVNIAVIKNGQEVDTSITNAVGLYWTSYLESQADHYILPIFPHYSFKFHGVPVPSIGYGPFRPGDVNEHQLDFEAYQSEFPVEGHVREWVNGQLLPKPYVKIIVKKNGQALEILTTDADGKYTSSYLKGDEDHYLVPSFGQYVFTYNG